VEEQLHACAPYLMVQVGVGAEVLGKVLGLGPGVSLHDDRVVLHGACCCLPAFLLLRGPIAVAAAVAGTVGGDALHVVCLCLCVEGAREGNKSRRV